ncbi:fucolectin-like [Onychostoma macrolepis]|uniref:fucolectin-like n=1 Tax=Onychostoma macrolepis TaxID=369639 RepID=UPI00272B7E9C|nr:fucolectin-like [Onychostoma macrolepis]
MDHIGFINFPGNRAVGGAVIQSSTFASWFAEKAVDSNRGFQQLNTACTSTLNETNPWWRLDLHDVHRVSEVVITNRKYSYAERINGADIRIGNSLENNGNNNPICAVIPAIPAGESYSYSCNGMEGRHVTVHIPGDWKTLSLCEVEVYGYLAAPHISRHARVKINPCHPNWEVLQVKRKSKAKDPAEG